MSLSKIVGEQIREKSKEIQNLISEYTKESIVSFFADFIRHNKERGEIGFSEKLKSKLKDSMFIISLRLSDVRNGTEVFYHTHGSHKVLEEVADIINQIIDLYLSENYTPKYLDTTLLMKQKLLIHESTFKNYFQNGILNYWEQEMNHVYRLFHPYKDIIKERLNISLDVLLEICDFSEEFYKMKSINSKSFILEEEFKKFISVDKPNGQFMTELDKLPDDLVNSIISYYDKPHECLIFTEKDYSIRFNEYDVKIFCDLFSFNLEEQIDYLFYTQFNPLELKPIIKINSTEYLNIYQKQLPTAVYKLLYKTVGRTEKEKSKLINRRGEIVFENHTLEIFKSFFKQSKYLKIYHNYYLKGNKSEKDILIIVDRIAYVIECKTSKFNEPLRDTEKAYYRIQKSFDLGIQKGYNQCYEVEKELLDKDTVMISVNNEDVQIDSSKLTDVFSIIVTKERYGIIQTDLKLLLKKQTSEDVYPWSVYIDDLEIFLKALKQKYNYKKFSDFLIYREYLNGHIYANDELDICSIYIKNPIKFRKLSIDFPTSYIPLPNLQDYFDELYYSNKMNFKKLYKK